MINFLRTPGELSNRLSKRISLVGTPFWMAPEVIRQAEGYDTRADIWSLGITLYEVRVGRGVAVAGWLWCRWIEDVKAVRMV
jgi:serine/threonine protein kinase